MKVEEKNYLDVKKMLDAARLQRTTGQPSFGQQRDTALFFELNVRLAELLGNFNRKKGIDFMDDFCLSAAAFLKIANEKKWTYLVLLTDKKISILEQKDKSKFIAQDYLILQKMLNKSYFERNAPAFVHAWHIFIKLGLVDFKFSATEIENAFLKKLMEGKKN
ncbi:dUTPase [Liquorilactobacillus oeni]|uniref:dUTPase n=1 Tax=Liquorilactobacillus oeni DSM 19972 TaxID=1423777 RepID=A0A0R1MEE5_9LACO|nr:dUTPase [Liquorilactobacillus oeni]KRL04244.1 hypothetical protein FD46_GL001366 [Liquorilactobacillus oeni DSM 19972]